MSEEIVKISINADKDVRCIKAIEDEGKYFILLEITKDKYERIKSKIKEKTNEIANNNEYR